MRITARWRTESGKTGRMPGVFGTAHDAENAAREFMAAHPAVTVVSISHETGGWLTDVAPKGASSADWRPGP